MKLRLVKSIQLLVLGVVFSIQTSCSKDDNTVPVQKDQDFKIANVSATYNDDLEQIVMSFEVLGQAGNTRPTAIGQFDGAPVMGYVFLTTLQPTDVGFSETEGILAMALTSHPDFDDTPLWDENNDSDYANDGIEWHSHWVVLTEDTRVEGGLSVKQFTSTDNVTLPPTNPGMPMYMDSPGFQVVNSGKHIRVVIPVMAINNKRTFNFDGVTAFMKVNTSNTSLPTLGVYEVYDVASDDLSLPYSVN